MSKLRNAFTLASIVVATAAWGLAEPASAQDVRYIGTHGAWSSFRFTENGNPVCYIASKPTKMQPANVRHGDVYLLVTDRPAEDSRNVVSLMVGYPYRSGSDVTVSIGSHMFRLFTKGDTAWSISAEMDQALVAAMKAGATLLVKAISSRGTNTAYSFSLSGVTAALREIESACDV